MSRILIISDTHGWDENMDAVISEEKPFDVLIHLGDVEGSESRIPGLVDPGCQIYIVKGNNDFFSDELPNDMEVQLDGHHILLTHGHLLNVMRGTDGLLTEAKEGGCDIAMFGHTHRPYLETVDGVTMLNPGSLSYPRQSGRQPSYMVMETDENGTCHYSEHYLGEKEFFW